ncbi:MAG: poly-gamma-glutamate system protein [Candidatus Aminicenantes bacterium]|nr:poly-gamma-glutamate system protein [Candidatus Aminicenantes bacterium]
MTKLHKTVILVSLVSVFFFLLTFTLPFNKKAGLRELMVRASTKMSEALRGAKKCRDEKGVVINKQDDINLTGLIGTENSPITTSVGNLQAKRTTTNPNFAGLVVKLLHEAGVQKGQTVAVEASGSFPGLIISVFSAAEVMDLNLIFIVSLGASQWGANELDFNWLNIQECLLENGIFNDRPVAVSLGGENDVGGGMEAEGRIKLLRMIRQQDVPFVYQSDLERNVQQKIALFKKNAGEQDIAAFINIGGSYSGLGTDSDILKVKPGLTDIRNFPPSEKRGLVFEMAFQGYPVIHLLYIKGITQSYGLPWDPVPLPESGKGAVYDYLKRESAGFLLLVLAYFAVMAAVILYGFHSHFS